MSWPTRCHHQSLGFRGAGQVRGFVQEGTEERVWERSGELERAAQEVMERVSVADVQRAGGAARERVGEYHAEPRQSVEDIVP